jgi:hypothetical protein
VVPAAHYTCGGVVTDLAARTDLPASTPSANGLHRPAWRQPPGQQLAARMRGVFGGGGEDILAAPVAPLPHLPQWDESRVRDADEEIVISHNWANCAASCGTTSASCAPTSGWNARCTASACWNGNRRVLRNFRVGNDLIELRNLVLTAHLIVKSAQRRHESRGLHFSRDYPETLPSGRPTGGSTPAQPKPQLPEVLGGETVAEQRKCLQAIVLPIQQYHQKRQNQGMRMYHSLLSPQRQRRLVSIPPSPRRTRPVSAACDARAPTRTRPGSAASAASQDGMVLASHGNRLPRRGPATGAPADDARLEGDRQRGDRLHRRAVRCGGKPASRWCRRNRSCSSARRRSSSTAPYWRSSPGRTPDPG